MNELSRLFVGELLGTMVLIILGDGVVAAVLLSKSKAENAGWVAITAGWGFAVLCGIVTAKAFGGSGAINPVGPLTGMINGSRTLDAGLAEIAGEFVGAFVGAIVVWLNYLPHWRATSAAPLKLAVFCTGPAIRNPAANLLSEMIATFVLVFVAGAIGKVVTGTSLQPAIVGALVWGIGLSLGGTTGYAINPARDFSPRLAHALLPIPGKGDSDWGYAWIPVLGPVLGAVGAIIVQRALEPTLG